MVILSLALAGCGGDSDDAAFINGQGSHDQAVSQTPQMAPAPQEPATAGKQYQQPGSAGNKEPEVEIDNPILAEPLPVPVPEGEGPDPVEEDPAPPGDGAPPTGEADPDIAEPSPEPEPEPEEPGPVADRPTLHWDTPLTREDGSKLYPGEVSGYRVYYRLRHQDEFQSLQVDGPDADSLVLENFDPGAYEFAVSALDTDGLESRRSEPVPVDLI